MNRGDEVIWGKYEIALLNALLIKYWQNKKVTG
jgi:hypothetical protein